MSVPMCTCGHTRDEHNGPFSLKPNACEYHHYCGCPAFGRAPQRAMAETTSVKWQHGVGVLWIDRIRSEFKSTEDVGEKLLLLHELLQRTWGQTELRKRTRDGDRMGVKDQRTARGMRLLIFLGRNANRSTESWRNWAATQIKEGPTNRCPECDCHWSVGHQVTCTQGEERKSK